MNNILSEKFKPITSEFGFISLGPEEAADAFLERQVIIQERRNVEVVKSSFRADFPSTLMRLLPLTSVEGRRFLFIPTRSRWTAFLANGHLGTDVFAYLALLIWDFSCEAVRAVYQAKEDATNYPATIFELFGPDTERPFGYKRTVSLSYDGSKWEFYTAGEELPFEETASYTVRRRKDRFTGQMLERYLANLGIDMFDESFYCPPDRDIFIIEKFGEIAPASREFMPAGLHET